MADLIDRDAEIERLQREIGRLDQELQRLQGKLSNSKFVDRAPAEVVAKERDKLAAAEQARAQLAEQLAQVENL